MTTRSDPLFISTAIPYVNSAPHLGFALELVIADAVARRARQSGREVYFVTGTDDNAISNVRAASEAGRPIAEFVDENAAVFESLRGLLGITWDGFIRTSKDARHLRGAAWFFERCLENGDIYTKSYSGLYCVGCELFLSERELVEGRCPDHLAEPEIVEEENHFFRLSRYTEELAERIGSGRLEIFPEFRGREIKQLLEDGLEDISISRSSQRSSGWGIAVPGDPSQTLYVWFDALTNYVNALGGPGAEDFDRFWDRGEVVHVIGKNIVRQHALFWPAILLSAGVRLPDRLVVHGFITRKGRKLSKSTGNTIDPFAVVESVGAGVLRYFLLKASPGADIRFSADELFRTRDLLADGLGNLLSRVLRLIEDRCNGLIPAPGEEGAEEEALRYEARAALDTLAGTTFDPSAALGAVDGLVGKANPYIVTVAPWTSEAGQAGRPLETQLFVLAETLRIIAWGLQPYLPHTSAAILDQLGAQAGEGSWGDGVIGCKVSRGDHLFPKHPAGIA